MDRLETIFNKQMELIKRFHDIEVSNGNMQTEDFPVNLHDRKGQYQLKDMAWRFTEESAEAIEVYINPMEDHDCDLFEELVDGLHFLAEFTINAGFTPTDLTGVLSYTNFEGMEDSLDYLYFMGTQIATRCSALDELNGKDSEFENIYTRLIMWLGMTCNTLRNKPWKQRDTETNVELFLLRLQNVWTHYMALMSSAGMSQKDIYIGYMSKHQKNHERIDTGQ